MRQDHRFDHAVPPSPCPGCGKVQTEASHANGNESPSPGDCAVCADCGSINVFDHEMRLRRATEQDFVGYDEEARAMMRDLSARFARKDVARG